MDLFQQILNTGPKTSDSKLLIDLDNQGKMFNKMQGNIGIEASKYLNMKTTTDLGGIIKEGFETQDQGHADFNKFQKQISEMGIDHKNLMKETSRLISFINNPKYRGEMVVIKEVSGGPGLKLVTNGTPIIGYVNSSSIFMVYSGPASGLPANIDEKKNNPMKVEFELSDIVGDDRTLYIVKDASSKEPIFLFAGDTSSNINNIAPTKTYNPLKPNVGEGNLDGASTNLFITHPVNTDITNVSFESCSALPTGSEWKKAGGANQNWSHETCKVLADSQGSTSFALGADSWKLNVIHAGSSKNDLSETYICGKFSGQITRTVELAGSNIGLVLALDKDPPAKSVKGNVCWPVFVDNSDARNYITYVISRGIWVLIEDTACSHARNYNFDKGYQTPNSKTMTQDCLGSNNKVVSEIKAQKSSANPLGEWVGEESIIVLLNMNCYHSGSKTKLQPAEGLVLAGQFDGTNSILFQLPSNSGGIKVGVDGFLYSSGWWEILGGENVNIPKEYVIKGDVIIGVGGSNMKPYYDKVVSSKSQLNSSCIYGPDAFDGYPVLNNYNAYLNEAEIVEYKLEDAFGLELSLENTCSYTPSIHAASSILNGTVPNWCTDNAPSTCINYGGAGANWCIAKKTPSIVNHPNCPESTYSPLTSTSMVNDNIKRAISTPGVASKEVGLYSPADLGNRGSGGIYTIGSDINRSCLKKDIPITGAYKCGTIDKTISSSSRSGSKIDMTCPGEAACKVFLHLSNEGELMLVKGNFTSKISESNIIWKTSKIAAKAGVLFSNQTWRTANNAYKNNGKVVSYINGNETISKGDFLLSDNSMFRLCVGIKNVSSDAAENSWHQDFLKRFQILDESSQSRGDYNAMNCDNCVIIEYNVQSCKPLQFTLKFDSGIGRYVLPANKERHVYSITSTDVAVYNNPTANNTGLYKSFYIDEFNIPYMLNKDAHLIPGEYRYFGNFGMDVVNSKVHDYKIAIGSNPSETEKTAIKKLETLPASKTNNISAFNLDTSTGKIWILSGEMNEDLQLYPPEISMKPGLRLYVRVPERKPGSVGTDCASTVFTGDSKDIIGQANGPWTNDLLGKNTTLPKKCNLARNLAKADNGYEQKYKSGVHDSGNKLASKIPQLSKTRDNLAQELSTERVKMDTNVSTYEKIYKKVIQLMQNDTVDGQLETAQLKLVEDNYQYILWSILAVALVMFAMSIQRK